MTVQPRRRRVRKRRTGVRIGALNIEYYCLWKRRYGLGRGSWTWHGYKSPHHPDRRLP